MDISDNMDSLDDSSTLPELSFDDLLDASPIKKTNKTSFDDDALELDNERKNRTDDTLNTPGPKKPPTMQKTLNTSIAISSGTKTLTPVRTHAVKLGNSPSSFTQVVKNNGGTTTTTTSTPVLLNTKNVLPKTATQIPTNSSIKLTQKVVGGNSGTANLAMSGKTAVRTSNGQIIYIQKTPANIKAAGGGTATNAVKSPALAGNNSKPVTIQVLRTADGSYVPIKTSTAGTNGKNTTLTLSPTSLAGKKIISTSGGQVIIKGTIKPTDTTGNSTAMAKTMTTNVLTGVRTVVKPMTSTATTASGQLNDVNKSKPIVVQATGGKQIIVSNQNIVKLSPKPQTVTTTAGAGTLNTTTTGSGQIHAIQIPGKIGVQYVRVLPNTKMPAKTLNSSAPAVVSSTATTAAKTATQQPNQPVKILNSLPQKFTVVQKGGTTKLVLKKDADFSAMTSKVHKTIVTVPTIKSLNEDNSRNSTMQQQQQQQSLIKTTQANLLNSNSISGNQSLMRKHKISEINTEIQRITTTADNAGPPEIKKPTPNNRVVVVSSNSQPKILNNSIQQPGRITLPNTTAHSSSSSSNNSSGMVKITPVTHNGNKLYTVLKPSTVDQKPNPKLYSVLKTNNQTTTTTPTAASSSSGVVNTTINNGAGIAKPLINKQQLIQQQQKLLQLKKQQQMGSNQTTTTTKSLNTATTTTSSSGYILPIKIKEEPVDSNSNTTTIKAEASNVQQHSSAVVAKEEDSDSLDPMVGGVRRKHCNCSKSQCLKLYCDCFANGEFCQDCTCKDCCNNLENEDERQRAIKSCLERNPNAFKPKITSSRDQADMRLHNKGCNCKRSGCLKNYCECYEAKIPCSSNCKCVGCRNVEDRPDLDMDPIDPKIMATIAMGGSNADSLSLKRSYDKTQRDFGVAIKTEKKDSIKSFSNYDAGAASPTLEGQQCNFITQEVIDATIQCMITQADECEKNNLPAYQTEKMVMEELGRCLVEIIDFSIRTSDNSYTQD